MAGRDEHDDDDQLDDASLRSMRAVWLSMRDEEPPAAGMSALLAAAREKAEQMRAEPSWWQRVVAQLRRPPVLAFATVMILIGGAVLVTRSSEDQQVDALSAGDRAPAAEAPTATGELRVRGVEEAEVRDVTEQQPGDSTGADIPAAGSAPTNATEAPAAKPEDPTPTKATERKDVVRERPAKPRRPSTVDDERAGKNEPDRHDRFDDGTPTGGFTAGKGGAVDTTLESPGAPGRVAPATPRPAPPDKAPARPTEQKPSPPTDKPAPKPAPASEKAPEAPTQAPEPDGDTVILSDGGKASTPPNEQLARQAESAAARGDCAAVRVIVARLKKQDEAFFKTRLGKNAAVAKCL